MPDLSQEYPTSTHQPQILLTAINSTYQHCSIGIRYLYANLGPLKPNCQIREWTIKESPLNIAEQVLELNPKIFGLGIYIWNVNEALELCTILKSLKPDLVIILGGPEVSYETTTSPFLAVSDHIVQGEADFAFRELCAEILSCDSSYEPNLKPSKIIPSSLPELKSIALPYDEFSEDDIKNRIIYVEASRGCPYKCEYCLSSLDKSVRSFDLEEFLSEIQKLIDRGARTFKFVDRTFNLSPKTSTQILEFFLKQIELGFFLHFEMVPDRLPVEIRELIKKFPAGSLQFEVGIQTLNPEVAKNVSRRNDLIKVEENFKFLNEQTHVHTHADLIAGLPGETVESFMQGLDRLYAWGPHEIQIGILKRLKGTPIIRHDAQFKMVYSKTTPFQILKNSTMSFQDLQFMTRFGKFWDLVINSGDFPNFRRWLEEQSPSISSSFIKLVEFLQEKHPRTFAISLMNLTESLYQFMIKQGAAIELAVKVIQMDYCDGPKKRDIPPFLKMNRSSSHESQPELKIKSFPGSSERSTEKPNGTSRPSLKNTRQLNHLRSEHT